MALTDFCDVLGRAHEDGFNRFVFHIMSQRPSLFHYGTATFVNNPDQLCCPPEYVHPEVRKRNNPIVHLLDFLEIPGYGGNFGLEYNFSLHRLAIDFEPTNQFDLPAELGGTLGGQSFAIRAAVCGGIACPDREILNRFVILPDPYRPDLNTPSFLKYDDQIRQRERPRLQGLPFQRVNCFALEVYATLNFRIDGSPDAPVLGLNLQNIEIVDLKPEDLENSLECYIRTALILGIFPQLRIAFASLTYSIANFIKIQPTPISTSVPFNPAVEKDTVTVLLNLETPVIIS